MIRDFYLGEKNAIINFSVKYCTSEIEILSNKAFTDVLNRYIAMLENAKGPLADCFLTLPKFKENLLDLFKTLLVFDVDYVKADPRFEAILKERHRLHEFIEGLYDFWRRIERYAVIQIKAKTSGIDNANFIDSINDFSDLVLKCYRTISEKIIGESYPVYRQLPAGVNVGLIVYNPKIQLPRNYEALSDIDMIDTVVVRPPFMIYSKKNKRDGIFREVFDNPLPLHKLTKRHWLCYPIKVGSLLAHVYFHRDFMHHGVSLCNLFQPARKEEVLDRKPDLIYVYGHKIEEGYDGVFHHDKESDIHLGLVKRGEQNDYFGYMKKMLLTLHNVKMIADGHLPIHGAMVNIRLRGGQEKNVVIIGDSGAGKSETLEALRIIGKDVISDMKIIFDDMGTFMVENNKIVGYGTEIGAFVRLDDLENGYAYKEMDRAIFLNPDKINARLLLPVATYVDIMKGHDVDMVLYANNYEDKDPSIQLFENCEQALDIFKSGARMAKGTTTEIGLVRSYFANPFGPVQKKEITDAILKAQFELLFELHIPVGEIYTRLALEGHEKDGPQKGAKRLFEWIAEGK